MARISERDVSRGERITDLMNGLGWSDISLADELGRDRTTVWRWKKGEPIEARYVGQLAGLLETSRGWIVSGPPEAEGDPEKAGEKLAEAKRLREQGGEDAATGS